MMSLPRRAAATLEPLIHALAAAAQVRIAETNSDARESANQIHKTARQGRERILADATAAGRRDAESAAALASDRIRRQANELVLGKQEQIRTELRDRVRIAALELVHDPDYPDMLKHLTGRARRLLGADAIVSVNANGGVTAVAGSRRVDLTLPTLAATKFDELTGELSQVWRE